VRRQGIVSITASSTEENQCHQVVDYGWDSYWYSHDQPNSWIQFDFKDRRISVTNYTIKSDGQGGYHLVEWSIEGSNDGNTWIPVDARHTEDLCGDFVVKSYACESRKSAPQFFRFIRLIQTGKNSSNSDYLLLGNLEFFGDVMESTES
jgi:hypothetical protein